MRIHGVDLLRGIAAFGIVGCHLSLAPRMVGGELVTMLCDFNVGVFAAIAGLLMGTKVVAGTSVRGDADGTLLEYIWRRVKRLLPTYFFWSIVFIGATCVFDMFLDGGRLNPQYGTIKFWLKAVFLGGTATHLWFLPCLLYSQIALRIISMLPMKGIVWILFGLLLIVVSVLMGSWFGTYPLRLFAFLVTGYGLGRMMRTGCGFYLWGCLTAVGIVSYVLLVGVVPAFIRGWFATIPLLVFFVLLPLRGRVAFVANVLGATSMGVYLVHPLITRGLSVIWGRVFSSPFGALPVLSEWILAWIIAFAISLLIRKMPIVKRFVQ